jgi:hypothetical protein
MSKAPRRQLLLLTGAMLLAPRSVLAQSKPVGKIPRVAFILATSPGRVIE